MLGCANEGHIGNSEKYSGQNAPHKIKSELESLGLLQSIFTDFSPGFLLQKDFVERYNPQNITLSIGGNDIGFANVVKNCVMPKLIHTTCYPTAEDQIELAERITGKENDLKNTYRQLSKPGRKLYVIGYPQIVVRGGNCANNVHLDDSEIQMFTNLTDLLNRTIKKAADGADATYVDVSDALVGHRMCETRSMDVAINGFTAGNDDGAKQFKFIGAESYHPNALGHQLLKEAILRQTNNLRGSPSGLASGTGTLPLAGAPRSNRPTSLSLNDETLVPDIVAPLSVQVVAVGSRTALLKSSSPFNVKIDTASTPIATITTDAAGGLSGNIQIPESTPCGLHSFHVTGQNIIRQPVDITKEVYVAPDSGCPDDQDGCGPLQPVGIDIDKDGIDDACDPLIAEPPQPITYRASLVGSSIHVVSDPTVATAARTGSEAVASPSDSPIAEAAVAARTRQSRQHVGVLVCCLLLFGVSLRDLTLRLNKA
jgi:lysophospholipase L1-like esterase